MDRKTVALIIPTMDKLGYLKQTLPQAASIGFDEVIVIDSSLKEKEAVESLCKTVGAKYVFTASDRLRARNLGARLATEDWVCIADDDVLLKKFDFAKFQELAQDADFMIGGWGKIPGAHYAWIFRRNFFLDVLKGYDLLIAGGDDLDITLRAEQSGKGFQVFDKGLYESEAIGLKIAMDYPSKWIRNKALYALTMFPLVRRHPFLVRNLILADAWRLKRLRKGEGIGRLVFESLIERMGLVYSPAYYLLTKSRMNRAR